MLTRIWKEFRSFGFLTIIMVAYPLVMACHLASPFAFRFHYSDLPMIGATATQSVLDEMDREIYHFYYQYSHYELIFAYLIFLMVAVRLFGAEYECGALGRLLAQPITRRRIWLEKTAAFFLLVLVLLAAHEICFFAAYPRLLRMEEASAAITHREGIEKGIPGYEGYSLFCRGFFWPVLQSLFPLFYLSLFALSCGLTASIFIRKTHTAFWAALVFPLCAACMVLVSDSMFLRLKVFFLLDKIGKEGINMLLPGSPIDDSNLNAFAKCIVIWFLIVYPLGWLKFKRLEV